jgi:hypothetical protein
MNRRPTSADFSQLADSQQPRLPPQPDEAPENPTLRLESTSHGKLPTPTRTTMAFSLTSILPLPDMLALGWFFLCWVGYAYYADQRRWGTRELASVLHDYRLRWMTRVLERENRIAELP